MYRVKVTTKGQLTIPKELRNRLGINTGDYLQIKETSEGYLLEKAVNESRFKKYIGLLNRKSESDKIIKDLRGE